jgi:hypothetical protein
MDSLAKNLADNYVNNLAKNLAKNPEQAHQALQGRLWVQWPGSFQFEK